MTQSKVVHFGPLNSKGGMSAVIKNLVGFKYNNIEVFAIATHCEGTPISKLLIWNKSLKKLKTMINKETIDIAHFHVTHSLSWWRKRSLMMTCQKYKIPFVIHIHSGRFQEFLKSFFGITGLSFKKIVHNNNCKVITLEKRWLEILSNWIPEDAQFINNPIKIREQRKRVINSRINLLMLARNDKTKGHNFAIEVAEELIMRGYDVRLNLTGYRGKNNIKNGAIEARYWVNEEEKDQLIDNAHFMLLPSKYEGSSMSIIEAMSRGLPVLSTAASFETIGISKLILDHHNLHQWVDRIIELSKDDRYEKICNNIYEKSKKFSQNKINKEWNEVYNTLLDKS